MFTFLLYYQSVCINLFETANIIYLSYIPFELLNVEHGNPISHINVLCKYVLFCFFAEDVFQYIDYHKPSSSL